MAGVRASCVHAYMSRQHIAGTGVAAKTAYSASSSVRVSDVEDRRRNAEPANADGTWIVGFGAIQSRTPAQLRGSVSIYIINLSLPIWSY